MIIVLICIRMAILIREEEGSGRHSSGSLFYFFSLEFVYAGDPNLSIIIPVVKLQEVVQMARKNDRPPQERYSITIEEAAGYSLIGENRLRRIIEEDRTLDWVLRVGSQVRIKRVLFEKWLDGKSWV